MGFIRLSGIAAIGFAALIVLGNVIVAPAGLPLTGAGSEEVDDFFSTEGDILGIASALTPAAWVLAALFGTGAVAALWRHERERGEAWSILGLAGLVMQNTIFAGIVATRLALTSTAAHDTSATSGLWALHEGLFTLNGTFLAVALLGLSMGGLRNGLIRRWHGGMGLLAAALQFGSATLAYWVGEGGLLGLLGLAGWLIWVVWIVVYGIVLVRVESEPAYPVRSRA